MSDRLSVDPEALRNGGVNLDRVADIAVDICDKHLAAVDKAAGAGGTGQMGQRFDTGYRPTEQQATGFLRLLRRTLTQTGSRTIKTAGVFAETSDDAEAVVQPD
ncbi:hypothetical protein [Actinokineospora inagensis]|uniref:hypothetical protein n=1 Tax=Actinokineospora inagensis TaxID=103730 RepID=UPI000418D67E|nr:hypothetical protein [Actinokineospora inagensis]